MHNTIFSKVIVSASIVHVVHLTLSSLCSSFPCQGQFSLLQTFHFTEICKKSKSPVFMYYYQILSKHGCKNPGQQQESQQLVVSKTLRRRSQLFHDGLKEQISEQQSIGTTETMEAEGLSQSSIFGPAAAEREEGEQLQLRPRSGRVS